MPDVSFFRFFKPMPGSVRKCEKSENARKIVEMIFDLCYTCAKQISSAVSAGDITGKGV